jgi:hypothetical protein
MRTLSPHTKKGNPSGPPSRSPPPPTTRTHHTSAKAGSLNSPGGDGLIVDLRLGDSYGAVFLWDHETWVLGVPLWGSVASMLQDIAVALESGTPALLRHAALGGTEEACVAVVEDTGDLIWEVAEH